MVPHVWCIGDSRVCAELKAAYEKIVRLESNTLDFESELRQARIALTLEIERKQAAQGPRAAATPTRKVVASLSLCRAP